MGLSAYSMQYLNQMGGLLTFVEIQEGVANAYKMVPVTCWHNGNKFPHDVEQEIREEGFRITEKEGLEYFLVPESTINARGQVLNYAVNEPPAAEVHDPAPPPAVEKYLKTADKRKIKRLG